MPKKNQNQQMTIFKTKNRLFVGVIQDDEGRNIKLMTDENYENLWFKISAEAKSVRGWWTMFDLNGRAIDGDFKPRLVK